MQQEITVTTTPPYEMSLTITVRTRYVVEAILKDLIQAAKEGRTMNYEQIAQRHGLPATGSQLGTALSPLLARIYAWCFKRNLPPLPAIVVRKSGAEKGLPGNGFWVISKGHLTEKGKDHTVAEKRQITADLHRQVFDFYSTEDI